MFSLCSFGLTIAFTEVAVTDVYGWQFDGNKINAFNSNF
jgi:hypothetical protein